MKQTINLDPKDALDANGQIKPEVLSMIRKDTERCTDAVESSLKHVILKAGDSVRINYTLELNFVAASPAADTDSNGAVAG